MYCYTQSQTLSKHYLWVLFQVDMFNKSYEFGKHSVRCVRLVVDRSKMKTSPLYHKQAEKHRPYCHPPLGLVDLKILSYLFPSWRNLYAQ